MKNLPLCAILINYPRKEQVMKSNFEERLEALCGAEGLKAAKQLLKQNLLCGAWHDEAGHIHGVFKEEKGRVSCRVEPGINALSECSFCRDL